MAQEITVPDAASLTHGEAATFRFERDGEQLQGFVLRHGDGLVAYVNRCPHWYVDLDLGEGKFYAPKVDRIYCANHGALFAIDTGVCERGPCLGMALEKLVVRADGDAAIVEVP